MLVLALDTTSREGSAALAEGDRVLAERAGGDPSRPQAARLPGDLMALLEDAGIRLPDIDLYAVATGPGSFTGLRVGIATMQGLAFAARRPLVGISAFDALAHLAAGDGVGGAETATWIDAWRGEVYAARYEGTHQVDAPDVGMPDPRLERLQGRPIRFTGDGARTYEAHIRAALGAAARFTTPIAPPLAGAMARLAWRAADAGARPDPRAIRPLYVRRPDAEIARDARPRV
jgi:tRNA threonylcarbamoyladenosine biosynthesis protein TsaB